MTAPSLSLAAPPGHPVAQAVAISLAIRGTALERIPLQPADPLSDAGLRLTCRRAAQPQVVLRDPLAMLELTEDLHPDQPLHPRDPVRRAEHREGLAALASLRLHLDRICHTQDPRELDLEVHRLRLGLTRVEPLTASASAITLLDAALAPILWRLTALDAAFDSHLLAGFGRLALRTAWLLARPEVQDELAPEAAGTWTREIAQRGSLIARLAGTRTDWSAAIPLASLPRVPRPENSLLSTRSNTKDRSIGRTGHIR